MQKKLLGDTAIYGLSSILGRTLNYVLVPIHSKFFPPGEYGTFTELYAYIAFLNVIFTYGLETSFFRYATKEREKLAQYFNLAQSSIFITTLIGGLALYFSSFGIANSLGYPEQLNVVRWLILILCIDTIVAIPFARLRLLGKAKQFATFRIASILLNVGINVFYFVLIPALLEHEIVSAESIQWIYKPEWRIEYVFLANLIANGFFLLFFIPTWIQFRFSFSTEVFTPVVKYALPIMVLGLAGVTNEMLSRALLKYILPEGFYEGRTNLAALGIFGAVYKLSIFMTLAVQAFKYAYEPFFFKKAADADSKRMNSKVMTGFIYFTCISWILLTIILPELAPIFLRRPDYLEGLSIVPILLGGGVFLGVFYNLSVWYKLTDNNWLGAMISIGGAFTTIILNVVLIPIWGYHGSAWAAFITFLSMSIASYFMGRKHYPIPYEVGKGVLYLGLAFLVVMFFTFFPLSVWMRYLLGGIVVIVYFFVVFRLENLKDVLNLRRLS
ncbi:MAG: lipopolysaccharide biosynthesis protein [Cytophagales bacterium]|nr:lipopolysaccharide biosynthesis protein [Cytophagales bacterium]